MGLHPVYHLKQITSFGEQFRYLQTLSNVTKVMFMPFSDDQAYDYRGLCPAAVYLRYFKRSCQVVWKGSNWTFVGAFRYDTNHNHPSIRFLSQQQGDVKSIRFEPLERDFFNLLAKLEYICTKYFPDVNNHPTKLFNAADSLDVLRRINHEHALDKLKKELLEAEKKEPENNHKPSQLKSDTSVSKEKTPIDIPEFTQQNVKLKPENTTNSEEEKENQQQPKHTFPFLHHR